MEWIPTTHALADFWTKEVPMTEVFTSFRYPSDCKQIRKNKKVPRNLLYESCASALTPLDGLSQ